MTRSSLVTWVAAALVVVAAGFIISNATRNASPARPAPRAASLRRARVAPVPPIVEADQPAPSVVPIEEPQSPPAAVTPAPQPSSSTVAPRLPRRPASPAPTAVASADVETSPVPASEASAAATGELRYGIEVATFMFEGRAQEERAKLAAAVGAGCRIAPSFEDGARVYRVIIGPLAGRARAESLATNLFARGLIGEGRVVRWGRGTAR